MNSNVNNRTSISMLQELCVKYSIPLPCYQQIDDGTSERHTFIYMVTVDIYKTFGKSRAKRNAKYEAAYSMIQKLLESGVIEKKDIFTLAHTPNTNTDKFYVENLRKICEFRELPMPVFTLIETTGLNHELDFTFRCSIGPTFREATHTTHQGARQKAAEKMITVLETVILIFSL